MNLAVCASTLAFVIVANLIVGANLGLPVPQRTISTSQFAARYCRGLPSGWRVWHAPAPREQRMRSTREGHLRPRTAPQPAWRSLWFAFAVFPPLFHYVPWAHSVLHYYPLPYRLPYVFSLPDLPHFTQLATRPISLVHPLLAMNHLS